MENHTYTIKNESGKNITINSFRNTYQKKIKPNYNTTKQWSKHNKTFEDIPPSGYDFAFL
jgi:hypothetical protein